MTAANTDAEVEQLVDVLGRLADRFDLQPRAKKRARSVSVPFVSGSATRESLALVPARRRAPLDWRSTSSSRRLPETVR